MSPHHDITNEKRSDTKGADCGIDSENHPAYERAYDYADLVHHHNERGGKARGPAQKTEPTEEPDYESEGMIPHN